MEIEKRKIVRVKVRQGDGLKIAKLFGVTPQFVSNCMTGRKNSKLAQKIRMCAVNRGGDPIYDNSINQ